MRGLKFVFVISGLIYSLGVASPMAHAKETITWALNDLVPFYIQKGPFKGKGISDQLTVFFTKHLPQYEHEQQDMSFSRFFAKAKRGDLVCNPLLLKTQEREGFLSYSQAFKPNFAHVLVTKNKPKSPVTTVNFANFLEEEHPPLALQSKRSYGPKLDAIIKNELGHDHILIGDYASEQLFIMLQKGRVTHFLDTEAGAQYFLRVNPSKERIYQLSIEEDRLDRFGYSVCSKTPQGQAAIIAINKVIDDQKASREFRDILEYWVAQNNLARFRTFYFDTILN